METQQPVEAHVETRHLEKRYGGVHALRDVNVQIHRGEVHALVGENGAGKSTLGKIIAGAVRHDGGTLVVNGKAAAYRAPMDAIRDGIAIIDQELAMLPDRAVIDNVFLGIERAHGGVLDNRSAREEFEELVASTGFELNPETLVGDLRLADQQKVEILRALARRADLIVMDEPSAALTPGEVRQLHGVIRSLKARGATVVLVSHFLEEVLAVSDRVTILRDGEHVRTAVTADETRESIIHSMLGRHLTEPPEIAAAPDTAPVVLEVTGLTRPGHFEDVSLTVRAGEIVGINGLVGAGRTEVCRAVFGADRYRSGEVRLNGERVRFRSPAEAIKANVAMLPENRKELGLLMHRSVKENLTLPHLDLFARAGVLWSGRERGEAEELVTRAGVKTASVDALVSTLSGGNQQKVVLAKWLAKEPRLLIVDEPTRGVDIGAKSAIYDILRELASRGIAILVVSSELDEVLELSHRVLVMARGRIVAEYDHHEANKDLLLTAAFWTPESERTAQEAAA
ncbi:sugar ABC transporter ATP-binding protein [Leucobacter soli]|uniref:Ribose import ATP-binding protein RbsA n=1 Tax=Leucobacter soli TaxID=2812850 RepID=A0A916JXG3_9MICO|nr:sugar ABC transporter ATP-binding protein [Leucobacter soli]CAG7611984.1 Ribose import ATP-binding protein RbsA [Leucobacter soli]